MAVQSSEALSAASLRVKRINPHATLPRRGSDLAAGYDVSSAEDTVVPARGKACVSTGLKISIPKGTYARIAPRSGLAVKKFIGTYTLVSPYFVRYPLLMIQILVFRYHVVFVCPFLLMSTLDEYPDHHHTFESFVS